MSARVVHAVRCAPDSTSPVKMFWRCSCGGDGHDVPGAQLPCPSCGETIRVPETPTDAPVSSPELIAGVERATQEALSRDMRFDLRELAYRILINPDLVLFGQRGGGVGMYCRACTPIAHETIAYLGAKEGEQAANTGITFATSVSGLWSQALIHLAIHHPAAGDR
ncbi:hypothetical protein FXF51_06060 [Nonomuraea sp. PA05]|uniref:hypothetical protein n=1 Tax=Nonomuraea sp. PA05 TaxID=2604466 RepID=UPI0011D694D1|nr:hypothetical protein [Nonomuraea sp. PA05]TYB69724.1 hypothetical protein FXF51_06060 [Nonomuraea sp. PA05]